MIDTIKKYPNYYDIWKAWSEKSLNDRFYKLLVLIGLRFSPTFEVELALANNKQGLGIEYTKDIDRENCVIKMTNIKEFLNKKGEDDNG